MKVCNHPNCTVSLDTYGALTYGHGQMLPSGNFEIPCKACRDANENEYMKESIQHLFRKSFVDFWAEDDRMSYKLFCETREERDHASNWSIMIGFSSLGKEEIDGKQYLIFSKKAV